MAVRPFRLRGDRLLDPPSACASNDHTQTRHVRQEFAEAMAGDHFTIGLNAPGFTQYLRHPPIHSSGQSLSVEERGGFSFDQQGYTR
jgi:hypothetical protein